MKKITEILENFNIGKIYILKSEYYEYYDHYSLNIGCFETKEEAEKLMNALIDYVKEAESIMGYCYYVALDFDTSNLDALHIDEKKDLKVFFSKEENLINANHYKMSFLHYLVSETDELKKIVADEFATFTIEEC